MLLEALNQKKLELENSIDACNEKIANIESEVVSYGEKLAIIEEMIADELKKQTAETVKEAPVSEDKKEETVVICYGSGSNPT